MSKPAPCTSPERPRSAPVILASNSTGIGSQQLANRTNASEIIGNSLNPQADQHQDVDGPGPAIYEDEWLVQRRHQSRAKAPRGKMHGHLGRMKLPRREENPPAIANQHTVQPPPVHGLPNQSPLHANQALNGQVQSWNEYPPPQPAPYMPQPPYEYLVPAVGYMLSQGPSFIAPVQQQQFLLQPAIDGPFASSDRPLAGMDAFNQHSALPLDSRIPSRPTIVPPASNPLCYQLGHETTWICHVGHQHSFPRPAPELAEQQLYYDTAPVGGEHSGFVDARPAGAVSNMQGMRNMHGQMAMHFAERERQRHPDDRRLHCRHYTGHAGYAGSSGSSRGNGSGGVTDSPGAYDSEDRQIDERPPARGRGGPRGRQAETRNHNQVRGQQGYNQGRARNQDDRFGAGARMPSRRLANRTFVSPAPPPFQHQLDQVDRVRSATAGGVVAPGDPQGERAPEPGLARSSS